MIRFPRKKTLLEPVDKALLGLIRNALFNSSDNLNTVTDDTDWESVFTEAMHQTILPMALEAALDLPAFLQPSDELAAKFRGFAISQAIQNENLMFSQGELLQAFSRSDIPCVVLKGSSAAACYSKPELRVLGDIDILVSVKNLDKAKNSLLNLGYGQLECNSDHHLVLFLNSVVVELHFETAYCMDNPAAHAMRSLMTEALSTSWENMAAGYTFPVLSIERQAAFLLMHIQQHMKASGVGLRHLCDFVMFAARLNQDEWKKQVAPTLKKVGLLRFAQALIGIGVLWLGLSGDCALWCSDIEENICHELLMEFLRSGNFGRKDDSHRASSVLTSDKAGKGAGWFVPLTTVRNLNLYARKHYPITLHMPMLLPLFWVYLPLLYLHDTVRSGGRPDIYKTLSAARIRKKLLAKLEILEIN